MSGAPDEAVFRDVMSRFVTGVAVMTSRDADGAPHGMTANAVSSLSLDPLLVLVCVDRGATMAEVVGAGRGFALSFLAADQEDLSARFADPARGYGDVEFEGLSTHEAATGSPLLDGAAGWLDCALHDVHDGGDHVIVVGRVLTATTGTDTALLYTPDGYESWPFGGHDS